ncbi:hypothetical protein V3C99_015009 [Haemonchus contortus]|uniref:Phloem protein n=1 Tax=Haemonchus contortus TaxID=6289 RepID=A0A7I5ECP2_HAECO
MRDRSKTGGIGKVVKLHYDGVDIKLCCYSSASAVKRIKGEPAVGHEWEPEKKTLVRSWNTMDPEKSWWNAIRLKNGSVDVEEYIGVEKNEEVRLLHGFLKVVEVELSRDYRDGNGM